MRDHAAVVTGPTEYVREIVREEIGFKELIYSTIRFQA